MPLLDRYVIVVFEYVLTGYQAIPLEISKLSPFKVHVSFIYKHDSAPGLR